MAVDTKYAISRLSLKDPAVSDELPSQTLTATSDSSKLEAQLADSKTDAKEEDRIPPDDEDAEEEVDAMETEAGLEKLTESTIHTVMEHLGLGGGAVGMTMDPEEVEKLRREMEEQLALMSRHGDGEVCRKVLVHVWKPVIGLGL